NIILRSDNCSGHAQLSGVCTPCEKLLRNQTIKGMIERNADGFRPSTTYSHLTMREVQTLLRKKNKQINSLKLHALNLGRILLVRARHPEGHSRFLLAVSQGNIPRLHSIVANCLKRGDSIFVAAEKLYRASSGPFHDQSYTRSDHQQLYLFLQLGGPAAAELAHRCLGLPSINTAKRHIATVPLAASPKSQTMDEMLRNLDAGFPTPHPPPADGSLGPGYQIMVDEIKVEGRSRWAKSRQSQGLSPSGMPY
ncbi:hypothetical protein B0H10DRAFT_2329073, partial [Mycena sp. CBHHK59/15]